MLERHPLPKKDFDRLKLPLIAIDRVWWRIHESKHGPIFFGAKGVHRFDDPQKKFGVMYSGSDEYCAFLETFGHATGKRIVETCSLSAHLLTEIKPKGSFHVVDLTGKGLVQIGADARLACGSYPTAQKWSAAFHDHPSIPDGIYFRSRHDPRKFSLALFDRAQQKVYTGQSTTLNPALQPRLVAKLMDRYGFGLI